MRKIFVIFFFSFSFSLLISFRPVLSEKIVPQMNKKKNLEEDAAHMLMKKLEKLYKLNETNNGEIFNKEIESLKKQIEALQQGKVDNTEGNIGHLLENESKDDFDEKTIFGMDEEDLDSYDADFIGQSKVKVIGQAEGTADVQNVAGGQAGDQKSQSPPAPIVEVGHVSTDGKTVNSRSISLSTNSNTGSPRVAENTADTSRQSQNQTEGSVVTTGDQQPQRDAGEGAQHSDGGNGRGEEPNPVSEHTQEESPATQRSESPVVAPEAGAEGVEGQQSPSGNDVKVKYLDDLYDDILGTKNNKDEIHIPTYHSKYNKLRENYEFSMTPTEYQIVKNLFNIGFKKEGENTVSNSIAEVFKKVLAEEKFQKEFDNFVHGLYGFAKRHNYLSQERMNNEDVFGNLLKNAINLLNTTQMK
ncbi:merozoite surface protein 7 [Plasmodium gonderi]|uniref:Merozoite surface protein 7 n=1 Tax=Plasmodium gonderi TaxID=77519 RepID=A0A1Y1JQ81_PLAGO|nr:merozoite surface protein 7 [Plasmodium gonderi]GAW82224.1 merozoite surface protein 7 [Plasmodium gonderi]